MVMLMAAAPMLIFAHIKAVYIANMSIVAVFSVVSPGRRTGEPAGGDGRPVGGLCVRLRRQREHVGGHDPAPDHERGCRRLVALQWAVTGYMLVGAAVIVTSGALGDVLGRRKVFLAGLRLFVTSCALIALSESSTGSRRADDPGRGRLDHPGVRHEPAVGASSGDRRDAGDHALGRGVGRRVPRPDRWSAACSSKLSGWQGLFWIDAAIAAACIPLTLLRLRSRAIRTVAIDRLRRHRVDRVTLVPLVLALSEGSDWGWLGRDARLPRVTSSGPIAFVVVEGRVPAPLVDLALLRNACSSARPWRS